MTRSPVSRRPPPDVHLGPPFLRGPDERQYPNQGAARRAALQVMQRLTLRHGSGFRLVHEHAHAPGQLPHYHVEGPGGQRLPGHFFYGTGRLRRTFRGRPHRESGPPGVRTDRGTSTPPPRGFSRYSDPVRLSSVDLGKLHDRIVCPSSRQSRTDAGRVYECIVALDLQAADLLGGARSEQRRRPDLPRTEITLEGQFRNFLPRKQRQLRRHLLAVQNLQLIVPWLSAPAERFLRTLLAEANHPVNGWPAAGRYTIAVRETGASGRC